jgi:hypothetical protein
MYYQSLVSVLAPQKQADGSVGWALPIDPTVRGIHMGDISELGWSPEHSHNRSRQAMGSICRRLEGIGTILSGLS